MKMLLAVAASLVVGFVIGWAVAPGRLKHTFVTSAVIRLADRDGKEVGALPRGTPLVAESGLVGGSDLGWWGYAPVYFSTANDAKRLGVHEGGRISSITEITLSASSPPSMEAPNQYNRQTPGRPPAR